MSQPTSTPWLFRVGLFWLAVLSVLATALPSTDAWELQNREESDDGNTLWLMPLGASITAGFKSPDNNGYRKALYGNLTEEGWTVHMVGSKHDGDMKDNVSARNTPLSSIKANMFDRPTRVTLDTELTRSPLPSTK